MRRAIPVAVLSLVGAASAARDAAGQVTRRVDESFAGFQANDSSAGGHLSENGRYVVFDSFATNLDVGDTNGTWDVSRHDRRSGATKRASLGTSGVEGNGASYLGAISANGVIV